MPTERTEYEHATSKLWWKNEKHVKYLNVSGSNQESRWKDLKQSLIESTSITV